MAIVGLGISCRRPAVAWWLRRWRWTRASNDAPLEASSAIALTSPPAQNAPPAPVSTTQPTSSETSISASVCASASSIARDSALRRSGRFMVRTATPSSTVARRSSVPVSSVVITAAKRTQYPSGTVLYSSGMSRSLLAQHPEMGSALRPAGGTQRARLLDAMIRVVAERGYVAASVTDVVRVAGVSRSTFYEQFPSKEACFLEGYRAGVDVLVERVREAVHQAPDDWRAQLRAGIAAYLETLASEPVFARAYLLEIHAAGPAALEERAAAGRRFADRYHASFESARASDPALRPPPDEALVVLCSGTEQLFAERVREERLGELGELEDTFCYCAEAVLLGRHEPAKED